MNRQLVLLRQARREFDEAADWYEARRAGLGARFTAAVQRVFDAATANPGRYPRALGEIREGPVHRFPYLVYYREEGDRIVVIAVYHTSRDPSGWQSRA